MNEKSYPFKLIPGELVHKFERMVLSRQVSYLSEKFEIFGGQRGKAVPFTANPNYEQYYIKLHKYEGDQNI